MGFEALEMKRFNCATRCYRGMGGDQDGTDGLVNALDNLYWSAKAVI